MRGWNAENYLFWLIILFFLAHIICFGSSYYLFWLICSSALAIISPWGCWRCCYFLYGRIRCVCVCVCVYVCVCVCGCVCLCVAMCGCVCVCAMFFLMPTISTRLRQVLVNFIWPYTGCVYVCVCCVLSCANHQHTIKASVGKLLILHHSLSTNSLLPTAVTMPCWTWKETQQCTCCTLTHAFLALHARWVCARSNGFADLIWFSLDCKGLQPGMAARPGGPNK